MSKINDTNFPDLDYLNGLIKYIKQKNARYEKPLDVLVKECSSSMNWIADYITDENALWTKEKILLDDLYLTGTHPEWNKIIIDKCERSPKKLKELFNSDNKIVKIFTEAKFDEAPILVRHEDGKYKVLDGMKRVIAAIRDDKKTILAYVARLKGRPRPKCEPHLIYDLLKAYHRGLNKDREALITALKFLRKSYGNADYLLKERFSKSWVPSDEIQEIIQEALKD